MEILKHYVPNVYQNVIDQMPPVESWEGFTFGDSVLGRQIARVVHPVKGIEVGQDGNGKLLDEGVVVQQTSVINEALRCSPCNPAHLAQNKFASILLEEARRMSDMSGESCIFHEEQVSSIVEHTNSAFLTVKTDKREIQTRYVVAADGSHSQTRNDHSKNNILAGNPSMQHLINVHFRTNKSLSKQLMERQETTGMLHFVFNKSLVGAFVCHNLEEGEW